MKYALTSIWNPFTFRKYVRGKGEWDYKNNRNTIYGYANHYKASKTTFSFAGVKYDAPDLGNIHFGATGKATGLFSERFLLWMAGHAQIAAGTSKPEWNNYREDNYGPMGTRQRVSLPPYGDDPRDQDMIKVGFRFYEANKTTIKP